MAGWTDDADRALREVEEALVTARKALVGAEEVTWHSPAALAYRGRVERHHHRLAALLREVDVCRALVREHLRSVEAAPVTPLPCATFP